MCLLARKNNKAIIYSPNTIEGLERWCSKRPKKWNSDNGFRTKVNQSCIRCKATYSLNDFLFLSTFQFLWSRRPAICFLVFQCCCAFLANVSNNLETVDVVFDFIWNNWYSFCTGRKNCTTSNYQFESLKQKVCTSEHAIKLLLSYQRLSILRFLASDDATTLWIRNVWSNTYIRAALRDRNLPELLARRPL